MSNPFFRPYEGEFFLEWGFGYKRELFSAAIPALSSSQKTLSKEVASTLSLSYGITESWALGVMGKYMIDQNYSVMQSGIAFAGNPGVAEHNRGFYDAALMMSFRFLGTRTEEWFANLDLAFFPGIKDKNNFRFTVPNDQYLGVLMLGKDFEDYALGLLSTAQYFAPSALDTENRKNNQFLIVSQVFIQGKLDLFYTRLAGGAAKFLDRASNDSPVKEKFLPVAQAEIGIAFDEKTALGARLVYVGGVRGETRAGNFDVSVAIEPMWQGSLTIMTAF
ncbi:MAG: hypothetical protein OHK0011_22600 [Turneriella sp.]